MKPVDVKSNKYINFHKEIDDGDPKYKMVILLEYQQIKILNSKLVLRSLCN